MRLKFVKGKQKELIKKFKKKNNLTWDGFCKELGVRYGRVLAYIYETSYIDEILYKKLDVGGDFKKYIIEQKEDNWGKKKGGINSPGRIKNIIEPKDSKELAEFYGIMLGDGNSHQTKYYKTRTNKRGVFMIRIVGDSKLDNFYLSNYVKPLIEKLFGVNVNVGNFKNSNAMFLTAYGIKIIEFLEKKGFPPGDKIKNKLRISEWIKNNRNYLRACLRGLYDTDGSVYKLTNQNSHQICFTNVNKGLLNDVREGLLSLGINCSKISKKDVYITKKSEIRKFLKLVGFNNNRHLKKVKMWKLDSPVV